ncbi:MAG: two-component system, cell cycle sensor histidine kinase and response regulator CckA, partial [Myxococcales bacterium]|nr:two-component system, cell cycle sensor histidine kinase and response regulator CckA [Myxococcales bacterium]
DEVLRLSRSAAAFAKESHNDLMFDAVRLEQQFVMCLKGLTRNTASFDGDAFDETEVLAAATAGHFGSLIAVIHITKQIVCFTYGRHDDALGRATLAAPFLASVMAMPIEATHYFYLALTLAALHGEAPPAQKKDYEQRLSKTLQRLAVWAEHCPENYRNRYALVAAEIARIEGRDAEAMRLYEEAIRSAHDQGFVHNEALAFELASAFYRARGFERFAESYLREARSCYARWGADGKVAQLDGGKVRVLDAATVSPSQTFAARTEQLDLISIVEALQTISGAIVLDDLVRTLLKIVLEQGGAQRATLLLIDERARLSVEAEAAATDAGVVISRQSRMPSSATLPQSIIDYVWKTRERVLLDDASGRSRFSGDDYVMRTKARSVLCLPIVRQGKAVGLLCLENQLLTAAFTPERLSVLELLASQAAISLENARLYAELERENADRRSAEHAMQKSKGVLEAIAENAPVVVFVKDLDGKYLLTNRQYERLFHVAAGTMHGRTDFDLFPRESAELYQLTDREALACRQPVISEDVVPQDDGLHTYIVTKFPLRDATGVAYAVGGIATDITDRMRATEALRLSEERFRLLVDGMKDCAIFMLDREGRVASWNAGAQRLFGYAAADILGQSGALFHTPEDAARGAPERALALAESEGSSEHDGWRMHKDGSRFFAGVVITALRDERGELRSYSALVRDLTQRLRLEEQVRQAQKMEAIGRLAGGVAHDFNNLLAAIYGFVYHGLKGLEPGSPVRADLEEIQEAARRAGELTTQLLAFARKQRVEPRVFDLNELVLSMDRLLRRVLGDDVELVTRASSDLGSVEADPGQIEQVILNLAVNARDAMPNGGALTIETGTVHIGEDYAASQTGITPGPFAMLALSDTGTGMTREVLDHVFEPFFTTKAAGEGTGLGLATSYGIVKQAGGYIWVYSEPGRGTTFKIYLPRSSKEATSRTQGMVASPSAKGETILLVEDHAMLRGISTRGLEALGYVVIAAQSGEEAIGLAAAHRGTIDLLLTDVVMPKMSGHEVAERLTTLRPGLRVLYVSGYTESTMLRSGEPWPPAQFLAKPFTPDQLARKVRGVLDAPVSA